jgi:hypothetical protein
MGERAAALFDFVDRSHRSAAMTRWNSSNNATAAASTRIALVTLVDLNFADQTMRLHDGSGTLTFSGNTYSGVGDYGSIETVDETTEVIAKTLTFTLSGVPGNLLTESLTQNYQGRTVTLYIGLFNVDTWQFVDTPETIWEGRMDYVTAELSQNIAKLTLKCENRLNREPLVARYTDLDQQIASPGDTFFNLVYLVPLSSAGWGAVTVQYPKNIPPTGRSSVVPGGGNGGGGGPTNANKN